MRVVLFSELNSKLGSGILDVLRACGSVTDILLVTRADDVLCSYFVSEPDVPDLKLIALGAGLPVVQSEAINTPAFRARIAAFAPDYLVVANYQKWIGQKLARTARVAALNVHPSPLPRYAGLEPFFWMAKAGETRGGTTCHLVADTIDGGDIVAQSPIPLTGRETTGQIRDIHFAASAALLASLMPRLAARSFSAVPQDLRERTYFSRHGAADTTIDWRAGVEPILRTVRASLPHPGALVQLPNGMRVRLTSADAYPAQRRECRPGTLERVGGDWIAATVDGWVRLNAIACFQGGEEPLGADALAAAALSLGSGSESRVGSAAPADDVLGQLMRVPVALAT